MKTPATGRTAQPGPDGLPAGAGRLVGVGVGPGDPELLTRQAIRVLEESDRVVAPSTAIDAVGRAESIVREALPGLAVERVVFAMGGSSEETAARALLGWLDAGEQVAFVTLGDPNIYSTFSSLAARVRQLRPGAGIATVAGIMAFQALAASTGTVLARGTEALSLVTALDGTGTLAEAVRDPERAVVVYKGGRHLPAITDLLARAGRLEGAIMGELLGLPGERCGPVAELGQHPAAYLATVVVPPVDRS